MAYWLMKSEPSAWSWDQQIKAGAKGAEWTGGFWDAKGDTFYVSVQHNMTGEGTILAISGFKNHDERLREDRIDIDAHTRAYGGFLFGSTFWQRLRWLVTGR